MLDKRIPKHVAEGPLTKIFAITIWNKACFIKAITKINDNKNYAFLSVCKEKALDNSMLSPERKLKKKNIAWYSTEKKFNLQVSHTAFREKFFCLKFRISQRSKTSAVKRNMCKPHANPCLFKIKI